MWFLIQSLHPKFTTTQQFLMGPCKRKASLWRGGDEEVFYFARFLQECSLVSAACRQAERASPIQPFIWHTKATSQEDKLSPCYSSSPLLVVSTSLTLSIAHSFTHTHSQAVISILMDVQENMNVNKWETRSEINKRRQWKKSWEWQRISLSVADPLLLICLEQSYLETQLDLKP